ncbi:hypothetical protein [Corallococcus exercitus]|uniref:Uncharacterized protein n=1 Tax=Corallococcus exercitus TaxID=2316736 RepID=A0A7Y4NE74_9BACT|nr:hypothetical protein [Corallococcus exercitus]NOK09595.1 hypothetical protein [Corallococcus exercitus]
MGYEPLAVPTAPRVGEIITLDGTVQPRAFALKVDKGRIHTFTCTAQGFEACQVRFQGETDGEPVFVEQEGRTTRVHFRVTDEQGGAAIVSPLPAGSTGTFQYSLAEREDDHGVDLASATRLIPGAAPVQGLLQAGPDTDMFVFDASAGHVIQVRCAGAFTSGIQSILFGPDGQERLSGRAPTGQRFQATNTGRYAFALSGYQPTAIPYTCAVEDVGADDHGDSPDTATVLPEAASIPLKGTLELSFDQDAFSFLARAGHAYALRCDTPTFAPCRDARVLTRRGEVLLPPVGVAQEAWLQVRVEANGESGAYALTLLDLGADQGSGSEDAVHLSGDVQLTGYLTPSGDVDFFRFDAAAGHVYSLEADGASVEAVRLEAPGSSLTRYDLAKVHHFLVDADSSVLLRVSGPRAQYRLDVREVGVDDHAGSAANATDLGGALSATGVLSASTDVDWFALTLEARPHALSRTSLDTKFDLFEADGVTPVPWDTASGAWIPRAAGRHLLRADMFGRFQGPDAYRVELLPR